MIAVVTMASSDDPDTGGICGGFIVAIVVWDVCASTRP